MTLDTYEFRYEQTDDSYRMQGFFGAPANTRSLHGSLSTRPSWLVDIVDVGAVAHASRRATNPPPDLILWFRTDDKFNLTEFINV